ncbi:hypothetical protein [Nocardia sp. CY41]|uniref:hypothetical protein n=1 Tax=Nocardia sp. CY41 TaxID=2608686 RepID=UPI00135BE8D9|nr:hypothetical protein [Nocardia sp. CY41]
MTFCLAGEVCRIVGRLLAVRGDYTPEVVAEACSVELREVTVPGEVVREFGGSFGTGPFSTVSFRGPATPGERSSSLIVLDVDESARIAGTDIEAQLDLSAAVISADPRIPLEGVVSFRIRHDCRAVTFQFALPSYTLSVVAVHEHM